MLRPALTSRLQGIEDYTLSQHLNIQQEGITLCCGSQEQLEFQFLLQWVFTQSSGEKEKNKTQYKPEKHENSLYIETINNSFCRSH